MSKYFKTKAGSLEEAVLAAVTPKQIEEGKLPPTLQKAIDKKMQLVKRKLITLILNSTVLLTQKRQ